MIVARSGSAAGGRARPLVRRVTPAGLRLQHAFRATRGARRQPPAAGVTDTDDKPAHQAGGAPRLTKQRPKVTPGNFGALGLRNFRDEWEALWPDVRSALGLGGPNTDERHRAPACYGFTLSNDAILELDKRYPGPTSADTPRFIGILYDVLLFFVDRLYVDRAVERFWFLETVARMPYFSYVTCLHLYETLGWWRTAELRKIHFAEEWNELHHLLIMEALGGDCRWRDRFLAFHAAIFYYWTLVLCFLVSPKYSYKFSEMLESHAVSTYAQFLIENEAKLKRLPPPAVAVRYYTSGDLFMFDTDSQLVRANTDEPVRRPPVDNLYDVFLNILEDEWEHVKTMVMCQDYETLETYGVKDILNLDESMDQEDARSKWKLWAEGLTEQEELLREFNSRR
eukprot:jgi/Tetstr1/437369/TSEL_026054.t1